MYSSDEDFGRLSLSQDCNIQFSSVIEIVLNISCESFEVMCKTCHLWQLIISGLVNPSGVL